MHFFSPGSMFTPYLQRMGCTNAQLVHGLRITAPPSDPLPAANANSRTKGSNYRSTHGSHILGATTIELASFGLFLLGLDGWNGKWRKLGEAESTKPVRHCADGVNAVFP